MDAKAKIKTEMDANKSNTYVQAVGEFLLQYLNQNPAAAERLAAADKTIVKSLDAMRTVAQTKKVGNMAVIAPQEGFGIILKYFGIDDAPTIAARETITVKSSGPKPAGNDFDVKLEDFL